MGDVKWRHKKGFEEERGVESSCVARGAGGPQGPRAAVVEGAGEVAEVAKEAEVGGEAGTGGMKLLCGLGFFRPPGLVVERLLVSRHCLAESQHQEPSQV